LEFRIDDENLAKHGVYKFLMKKEKKEEKEMLFYTTQRITIPNVCIFQ
jgi:hypothetical protein